MSIEQTLNEIEDGESKTIKGVKVTASDNLYVIDNNAYTLEEAAEQIEQRAKVTGIIYNETIFILADTNGNKVATRQLNNKSEHTALIEEAKSKKLYVYMSGVQKIDGKFYTTYPSIIDWASVPDVPYTTKNRKNSALNTVDLKSALAADKRTINDDNDDSAISCPYCNKTMTSTQGRTLHVKSKHPDKYDDYMKSDKSEIVRVVVNDTVDTNNEFVCPYCSKKMTSAPGRTLHVKSKHPDEYESYMNAK